MPEPDKPASDAVRPVFVDSSGRRQRRVRRAARLLLIPAGGYVALVISTMLGGPTIDSPFVPQPGPAHPRTPRAAAPDASPGTSHSAGAVRSVATPRNSGSAAQKTPGTTDRPAASDTPAATPPATLTATGLTSPAPAASPTPTPAAASTHAAKGRAIGSTHNPVK
ncbi:hypothetical protein RKE30_00815 [Streptomyces sp. Li-HN-5-11]|uniref:hypothetical protein n=1 Tax=Streptomyces sp. Li-HN-5-11 TaxID=3075432 RepID=UPI0028ABA63C|nr:hypothetical protein [Streptomyces sp. Li-HN-5-11]WNM29049.1 hypothetical protein RKE30_00815 [Streptomyces sp. Li-HN-5-11]